MVTRSSEEDADKGDPVSHTFIVCCPGATFTLVPVSSFWFAIFTLHLPSSRCSCCCDCFCCGGGGDGGDDCARILIWERRFSSSSFLCCKSFTNIMASSTITALSRCTRPHSFLTQVTTCNHPELGHFRIQGIKGCKGSEGVIELGIS